MNRPYIVEETDDFSVVYKPPKMHSVQLLTDQLVIEQLAINGELVKQKTGHALVEWYAGNSPGGLPDSGLMHRLDYETHGLVLFARNQKSYDFFKALQDSGGFIKEYSAICESHLNHAAGQGFPPPPDFNGNLSGNLLTKRSSSVPKIIESYFRPYGRGRKLVRPVIDIKKNYEVAKDKGGFYRTEITGICKGGGRGNVFTVRIRRAFRHQIRCHLCWIGCPIHNDPLYGRSAAVPNQILALRAHALFFNDPSTGKPRECRIESLPPKYRGDNN